MRRPGLMGLAIGITSIVVLIIIVAVAIFAIGTLLFGH